MTDGKPTMYCLTRLDQCWECPGEAWPIAVSKDPTLLMAEMVKMCHPRSENLRATAYGRAVRRWQRGETTIRCGGREWEIVALPEVRAV